MNEIGFLKPDGTLIRCNAWEHMNTAIKIAESMGQSFYSGIKAEEFLQKQGWLVIRTSDVYGLIGVYNPETGKRYHLSDEKERAVAVRTRKLS